MPTFFTFRIAGDDFLSRRIANSPERETETVHQQTTAKANPNWIQSPDADDIQNLMGTPFSKDTLAINNFRKI